MGGTLGLIAMHEGNIYDYDSAKGSVTRAIEGAYVWKFVVIDPYEVVSLDYVAKGGDVVLHIADYHSFATRQLLVEHCQQRCRGGGVEAYHSYSATSYITTV